MKKFIFLSVVTILTTSCFQSKRVYDYDEVRIDQCGYVLGQAKMAFVEGKFDHFILLDHRDRQVFEAQVQPAKMYDDAGAYISQMDFSAFDKEGEYQILVDDSLKSYPFVITKNPYGKVAREAVRALYYNRSGMAIDSIYGGKWTRALGHPDTAVLVHESAATKERPEGTSLSFPGGWYDAGDYNKYVVNSAISTYSVLLAAQLFTESTSSDNLNIPESGNGIPDIVDEALYNLRWMLMMQDPNDGGVYHKLTTQYFEGFIMPDKCKQTRYVVAKSTTAALDLAATSAFAARMLPRISLSLQALADSCRDVALLAYAWAEKHPNIAFVNPAGISTGEYGDENLGDEWLWASIEMFLTFDDQRYAENAKKYDYDYGVPAWYTVGTLGRYSMIAENKTILGLHEEYSVVSVADKLLERESKSPISISLSRFEWGSNSFIANEGMLKLMAYATTKDPKYYASALNDLHYLLGRNCTGYCFVTGNGSHSPMNIHHRPSASDDVFEPVPGFLVGGPNNIVPTDCEGILVRSEYDAKAYSDAECSYSTNEVTINWNAPLIFLVYGLMEQ